jgi:hypothetical protein
MTDKTLSGLTTGGSLASGDVGYVVRGGNSRKVNLGDDIAAIQANVTAAEADITALETDVASLEVTSTLEYETVAAVQAATIASTVETIRTRHYSTLRIGGGGLYKRQALQPSHAARIQSADGAWWELVPEDGRIHIFQLGGDACRDDSATSLTTIFNNAVAAAVALKVRTIFAPKGNYYFNTQPAAINYGVFLKGEHISFTIFNRNYAPGSNTEPFIDFRGGVETGGGIDEIFLKAAAGTNGVALRLLATSNSLKPSFFHIGKVVISYATSMGWYINCLIDGTNAPASGGSAGIRDVEIEEMYCFGGTQYGLDCYHCRGFHANFIYSDGDVIITGGTDPNSDADEATTGFYIDRLQMDGADLSISNAQIVGLNFVSAGSTTIASTTLNISVYGSLGTLTNNGGSPTDAITIGSWGSGSVSGDISVDSITATKAGVTGTFKNTTDNASVQVAIFEGDRATMADGDEAYISLRLSNDGGTQTEFARMTWAATDVNAGTNVDGAVYWGWAVAGTLAKRLQGTGTNFSPATSDGVALGTTALMWSDLFLADGSVINFNNGDVTVTHSADGLLFAGAATRYDFDAQIRTSSNLASTGGLVSCTTSGSAPYFYLERTDTLAAAGDCTYNRNYGHSAGGTVRELVRMVTRLTTATDAAEDSAFQIQTRMAGTLAQRLFVGSGLVVGSPTGGDKGAGTVNAVGVYDDNTLLTCYVFDAALDGDLDLAKWDGKVPDRVIEPADIVEDVETEDGKREPRVVGQTARQVIRREHFGARKFKQRIKSQRNPLRLEDYIAHWKDKRHLTSMPNEEKFDAASAPMAAGEWIQRLVETVELQAVHDAELLERNRALETRIATLETALAGR